MNSNNNHFSAPIYQRQLSRLFFVGVIMWGVPDAWANWQVSPELGAGIEYDDNTSLNKIPGLSNADTGYAVEARAIFSHNTQLTDLTITPRLRSTRYSDNDALDSVDQFLNFDFTYARQKSNLKFRGSYMNESVRTAERSDVDFDIEDPGEISADDTGSVFDTGKRTRLELAPEFSYDLSQRASLRVNGDFLDTSYDDDVSLILNGFKEYSIGAFFDYGWSEKDTISLGGYRGKYERDSSDFESTSDSIGVGYQRTLSKRTRFSMFIGSNSSEDDNGDDQSNSVGEVSIIHRYLTTRIIASYQRTTNGSGAGGRSLRDTYILNVSRDISPKLTLSGGIRTYSTDAFDSSNTGFDARDYLQIRASARWNVSRTVFFRLDYRYTDIERQVVGADSVSNDSNRIGLWVYWRPSQKSRNR